MTDPVKPKKNSSAKSDTSADDQKISDLKKERTKTDAAGAGLMGMVAAGGTLTAAEQITLAAYQASVNAATNAALSAIAQQASIAAAALKLSNDLNDATISFTKGIGSSVKSAAQ